MNLFSFSPPSIKNHHRSRQGHLRGANMIFMSPVVNQLDFHVVLHIFPLTNTQFLCSGGQTERQNDDRQGTTDTNTITSTR
jgi:hypothetical protein